MSSEWPAPTRRSLLAALKLRAALSAPRCPPSPPMPRRISGPARAGIRPFQVSFPQDALVDLNAAASRLRGGRSMRRRSRMKVAGGTVRDDPGARALLGGGLRLAPLCEATLNAMPQFMTEDRRSGHSLHPRSLEAREGRCRSLLPMAGPARSSSN